MTAKYTKKVGVIGGGIFGGTAAIRLAQAGYDVDLIEKAADIMTAASGINQYRLHCGYHYPRSPDTTRSSQKSAEVFANEYPEAIIDTNEHYYVIAAEGSLTTPEQFLSVCDEFQLPYEHTKLDIVAHDNAPLCVKVSEDAIDPDVLRDLIRKRLKDAGVRVRLNTPADNTMSTEYDFIIVAAYANMNAVLESLGFSALREYQYELCEKIVVKLPDKFANKSVVVLDGPFTCFDPYGKSGYFVMGHVDHAIHAHNIGFYPEIPAEYAPLLNRGVIKQPPITNFPLFIESAIKFFPEIKNAKHIGSMYTIRTVLPKLEKTDARPTIVAAIDESTVTIFSGKIGNCVQAAEETLALVQSFSK